MIYRIYDDLIVCQAKFLKVSVEIASNLFSELIEALIFPIVDDAERLVEGLLGVLVSD